MYDIITIGEILVEILAAKTGQEYDQTGEYTGPYPSGAPAIAIDQAGKMGAKAAIIAKIGKDGFGKINKDRLIKDGVDVSGIIETADNTTGVAFNSYFADGSRKYLFHFTHAACGELNKNDVNKDMILNSKYLHIMGCSITGSPSMGEAIMEAVRIASKNGVKISFDPNIRPELYNGKIKDYYEEILNYADVISTGKSELKLIYGEDYKSELKKLLDAKDRIIVIKNGSKGTDFYTRDTAFSIGTYETTEVDPTGAGDCFDCTILSMLCQGADYKTCVHYANAAGSFAVSKLGPMEGNTTKAELDQFFAKTPKAKETDLPLL